VARDRTIRASMMQSVTQPAGDSPWVPLAVHETPIAAVLARANKDSINLYAEALFKRVGFAATGQSGSWENGRQTVGRFLESIGVNPDEFQLDDGSGLSRNNRISANAMARVLAHRYASPSRDTYLASLSVAGFDGTLDGRFKDSDLRGRVYAKTGYIRGVSSMSGYVKAKDGQWYAFAILMNEVTDIASCKRLQERIVKAIDQNSGAGSTKSSK
jgi:serine-type D-Ala-D-Ala carboxypeptidase/endopeptidase (penicillin-binding protein 4)